MKFKKRTLIPGIVLSGGLGLWYLGERTPSDLYTELKSVLAYRGEPTNTENIDRYALSEDSPYMSKELGEVIGNDLQDATRNDDYASIFGRTIAAAGLVGFFLPARKKGGKK